MSRFHQVLMVCVFVGVLVSCGRAEPSPSPEVPPSPVATPSPELPLTPVAAPSPSASPSPHAPEQLTGDAIEAELKHCLDNNPSPQSKVGCQGVAAKK
jgi:uncharacterized protein YecT (DUF1311 family)